MSHGGWDKCLGPFSDTEAVEYGVDVWKCRSYCYTRRDPNGGRAPAFHPQIRVIRCEKLFSLYFALGIAERNASRLRSSVCVCVSVRRCISTLLHAPECNFGGMIGDASIVVHLCLVMQSVHGFRWYGNVHTYVYNCTIGRR